MNKYAILLIISILFLGLLEPFTTKEVYAACPSEVSYEGQTYSTVEIGSQCWLGENLDVGEEIDSGDQTDNGTVEKYCYSNCNTYGGLYQWGEAMQYDNSEGAQGICPDGWHIPTKSEWNELENNVCGDNGDEGSALAGRADLWDGSYEIEEDDDFDCSGFEALPAGTCSDFWCVNQGYSTDFWSSTESDSSNAWIREIARGYTKFQEGTAGKDGSRSVRCVKNSDTVSRKGSEFQLASLVDALPELNEYLENLLQE